MDKKRVRIHIMGSSVLGRRIMGKGAWAFEMTMAKRAYVIACITTKSWSLGQDHSRWISSGTTCFTLDWFRGYSWRNMTDYSWKER